MHFVYLGGRFRSRSTWFVQAAFAITGGNAINPGWAATVIKSRGSRTLFLRPCLQRTTYISREALL
jgi:hypothetical protein